MKSNKMGTHIKKNLDSFLTKLFGIMKFEQTRSRPNSGVKPAENARIDSQAEKTLLEAEAKKSEALELTRRLQNY